MVTRTRHHRTPIGCGECLTSDNLFCGLGLLPILTFILVSLAVFISYGIAVGLGHVDAVFPYVSYLGSKPPEGNIFAQCINTSAVLLTGMIYVRFLQFNYEYTRPDRDVVVIVSKVTAWVGIAGGLCFSMVANFPDIYVYHIDDVHDYSSIAAFSLNTVYFYMQSWLSYKARGLINGSAVCITRLVLSVISMTLLIITGTTGKQSYKDFHGDNDKWWNKNDGGYTLHIVSAVCEWLLVFTMLTFYLTFINEFKRHHLIPLLSPPREKRTGHESHGIEEQEEHLTIDEPIVEHE